MGVKIWKDKDGKKIDAKEFVKRYREGLNLITPLQRLENEVRANFITFIGYVLGIAALLIYFKKFVTPLFSIALLIIFIGAAWANGIKWIALRQQLKMLKNFDSQSFNLDEVFGNLEVKVNKDSPLKKDMKKNGWTFEEVKKK